MKKIFFNVGQNIEKKIMKLSKIGFSMEFLQLILVNFQAQSSRLDTYYQHQVFQKFF